MRLSLVMPTGLAVGYDEYFSSSPLGIESLAAHARQHADVILRDMRGRGHDVEKHARILLADEPDMIGLSINSAPHTNYCKTMAAELKRQRPQVRVVAGGQQATFLSDELLAAGFDAVVRGEGELTIEEILSRNTFAGVAGVSWRTNGDVHHEPDRPQIENLDDLKLPARDLLSDRSRYRMGAYRVEGIETSRGCPHRCSFCSIRNFHRGRWRPKSVERVMQEVDDLLARFPERKVIYFADDNFSTDIRRVEAICKAIVERRSDAYFWCQARADQLSKHPEVVEWMGKAHFAAVLMGIETPNTRLLKNTRKGTTIDQVEKAIELLHQHDVGVWGTFTFGLPGETAAETEQSAKFAASANVDVAQITVATPIPGSTLYDDAKAGDLLTQTDWDHFDFTSPTMKDQMSKKELDAIMHRAYLKIYLSPRFLKSLFTSKTNLSRLRRTALGAFSSWIRFAIRAQLSLLLGVVAKRSRNKR